MAVTGALIMGFFATVWWVVGSRAAGHGPAMVYPLPLVVAVALGGVAWRRAHRERAAPRAASDATDRARRGRLVAWASAAEGLAILVAAIVLTNTGHRDATVPAVVLIVGAHCLPLARGLPAPALYATAAALAGLGLMGVAKDNYPRDGDTYSFVIGFAEVEVDVETGKVSLVDFLSVGDVGRVVNPRSLIGQLNGGICLGIAHALCQKWVIDPQYGLTLARRFHYNKPLTILDVPVNMEAMALDMPDPETPVGARGVGEPPVGAGYGAVMNAIADAVGTDVFRRAPVTADIVLMSLEHGKRMHDPLRAHL